MLIKKINMKLSNNENYISLYNTAEFKKNNTDNQLTLREKGDNIRVKENYHIQSLKQAKIGFYFGIGGACIGVVIILFALIFYQEKQWQLISGIVTEIISIIIFSRSDKAMARMEKFFEKLSEDSNRMKAIDLIKNVSNEDTRDELCVKMALFLVGINEDKICKNSKQVCDNHKEHTSEFIDT